MCHFNAIFAVKLVILRLVSPLYFLVVEGKALWKILMMIVFSFGNDSIFIRKLVFGELPLLLQNQVYGNSPCKEPLNNQISYEDVTKDDLSRK